MKLGVIGTGAITKSMLAEYQRCAQFEIHAICSRKEETGKAMAEAFSIPKVYTDLSQMLADPEIEIVYVATPNSIHFRQAKQVLLAGKHVICEKPFTPTVAEAEELMALAKEKHLFLFEAITTAHHPHYEFIKENLQKLGKLKIVSATFCQFSSRYPALLAGNPTPVLSHEFAGGALMDINLYNVHFVVGLFGMPKNVRYTANRHETGVDTSGMLVLEYDGFLCQCIGAKDTMCDNSFQLLGDKGYIHITPGAGNLRTVKLVHRGAEDMGPAGNNSRTKGKDREEMELPEDQWFYEIQTISKLIAEGNKEVFRKNMEISRNVMEVLEKARKSAGMAF